MQSPLFYSRDAVFSEEGGDGTGVFPGVFESGCPWLKFVKRKKAKEKQISFAFFV